MADRKNVIHDLFRFLESSPTAFQASSNLMEALATKGFQALSEADPWQLKKGGKYYVQRNQSAVIAFVLGSGDIPQTGFRLIGAHTDSPLLKIKKGTEKRVGSHVRIGVEVYGGPIIHTWIDRELSIAGKVMVQEQGKWQPRLLDFKKPLAIIPNAAIHLNRDLNKGFEYNNQNHLPALLHVSTDPDDTDVLGGLLAKKLKVRKEQIGDYDLYLYDPHPPVLLGVKGEFFAAGRLDDLAMCHAILTAVTAIDKPKATCFGIFYDNEEVGNTTPMGAASSFLRTVIQRLNYLQKGDEQSLAIANAKSFFISADMAHALHPNYREKHDEAYSPFINGGPVVKLNANFRYATTSESSALFESLCIEEGIPYQKFINRSDMPSGSTIGPTVTTQLGIAGVDVGNPMLAMHSIRETAGCNDHEFMIKVFHKFYMKDSL